MKKTNITKQLAITAVAASFILSAIGCGCITPNTPTNSHVTVHTHTVVIPTSVHPGIITNPTSGITNPPDGIELPTLSASNLSITAGSPIDYLGNLVIDGEGDTEITEIYVNTSDVRPNVPGVYKATYTINFRGYPISKTIVITITPPADGAEIPTYASTLPGTPISDMVVTLLSGSQCALSCTTEHYIIESYTEEKLENILGKSYRTSVLKVLFNDGEIIELETVRSRVADNPK